MPRLFADADLTRWVPVTESFGPRGRRHRKRAAQMLMSHVTGAMGAQRRPRGFAAWAVSQAAPLLMRRAAGRVLVWVWKQDPELLVAMAALERATPQSRTARAMRPIEYDDTESFPHPTFGVGERLIMDAPGSATPPFVTYSFDLGDHFVEVTGVSGDDTRLRTVLADLDALVRTIRLDEETTIGESPAVLRLDPS